MTKRFEQSGGRRDRYARPTVTPHALAEAAPALDATEVPTSAPPKLTLVGGTDVVAPPSGPIASESH
jgi:hypothetical protein